MIDNRSSPSGFAVQTRLCRPTPGPRPTTGPDATSPHQFAPPPNKACSSGGKLSWTPFERYKVPEGRMRGRVVDGETVRVPSSGTTTRCSPTPGPSPATMSFVLGTAGRAGEGRRAANGEVVRRSPSQRRTEHPAPPQEPTPPPTAIAPGTGSFSRPPPRAPPQRFQPTSTQDRGKMCLSPSGRATDTHRHPTRQPNPRPLPPAQSTLTGTSPEGAFYPSPG